MKNRMKTFFYAVILIILIPLAITMVFQGDDLFAELGFGESVTETDTEDSGILYEDIEGKVVAIVAKEISVNSSKEAIKAQAVIARTNLIGAKLTGQSEPEGLTTDQMMKQFGEDQFSRCYEKLAECVQATRGLIMTCDNKVIEAPYFAISAGFTRSAKDAFNKEDISYLKSADSREDILAANFLKVEFVAKESFDEACRVAYPEANFTDEDIINQIEIISRDDSEYVKEIKVGEITVTGEEFRNTLKLNSACFTIKEVEGEIRIVTKGLGHGVGLSQYGANAMAEDGKTYEEILKKYYSNIKLTEYKNAE